MGSKPDGTYGIVGIPPPDGLTSKTKQIPYVPGLPLRLEITKLFPSNDPLLQKQWTLFILALEQFKKLPVDEKLSYFQVAGIHGYPETSWDNAKPPPQDPKVVLPAGANPYGGYCNHNQVTFPMWHRPYMLLFEQLLWSHMADVIKSWNLTGPEEEEWQDARNTWRLPYWDWARKQKYENDDGTSYNEGFALPYVFTLPKVAIYPPSGTKLDQDNPLWGFVNPEKDANGDPLPMGSMPGDKKKWNINDDAKLPWSECKGVSRYGIKADGVKGFTGLEGVNDFKTVNANLNDPDWYSPFRDSDNPLNEEWNSDDPEKRKAIQPGSLADSINRLFCPSYNDTWGFFSSTKWWAESEQDVSTGYLSLEYIHNNIHNLSGGDDPSKSGLGHMSDVPVAAFDPLFWMHHCNIDRLCAMWQALNWDKWWDLPEPEHEKPNVPDRTPETHLEPFHTKNDGNVDIDVWTSNLARDWTKLHYQYDDLVPEELAILPDGTLNEDLYKVHLRSFIQTTYPNTGGVVRNAFNSPDTNNNVFFGEHHANEKSWNDYIINVIYDRYALEGRSYAIQFWLSPEDHKVQEGDEVGIIEPPETVSKPMMIGQIYSLGGLRAISTESTSGCGNCTTQKDQKVLSKGQIPITIPIISRALDDQVDSIQTIRREEVETYLRDHLYWKFVELGGIDRDAKDFPDTKISVWRGEGRPNWHAETRRALPPLYSSYEPIYPPTERKTAIGGIARDDDVLGERQRHNWGFRTFPGHPRTASATA